MPKASVFTTTFVSRTPFLDARTKLTTSARSATSPSTSTTDTATFNTARPTTTTIVLPVSVDSSLPTREFAKPWTPVAFVTREASALTVFPTSDSKAANVKLKDAWISRIFNATDALMSTTWSMVAASWKTANSGRTEHARFVWEATTWEKESASLTRICQAPDRDIVPYE